MKTAADSLKSKQFPASKQALFTPVITAILALFVSSANAQVTSKLWGVSGEAWNPTNSILPDVSTVGYSNGLVAIPDWPVGVNVTNFGAIPDDDIDDSQAFIDAIAACPSNHAVLAPKGRYVIDQLIKPQRDHFVLRGEDMYETVLFFPKHLNEVYPNEKGWYPPDPEGGDGVRTRGLPKGFFRVEGGTERSIENLSFEFREERKMGHWENKGACAIGYADRVEHSWIRNIYVKNGDNTITLETSSQLSVLNVILDHYIGRPDADYGKRRFVSHEGIAIHGVSRSLIHNARMYGRYMHAIDNNQVPGYNVISHLRVDDGSMNHHGGGSHNNMYTDMNVKVSSLSDSGGQNHESHWNVAAEVDDNMYNSTLNNLFVGYGDGRAEKITTNIWYEPLDPAQLTPTNIYLAQLDYFNQPLPEGPPPPVPSPYLGEVIRINPTDDHYLTSDPADGPDDIDIPVGDSPFFKFDLTGIPMTHIAHVRFRLNLSSLGTLPYELSAWMVTDDDWSEATLSPENHPEAVSELDAVQLEAGRLSRRVEFDVTPFVQNEISGGDPVITLCVKASGGWPAKFYSSENGLAPELVIEKTESAVPGAPSAPTGLRSTGLIGNIILDWDDNPEADVATYKVYRSDSYTGTGLVGAGLVTSDFVDTRSGVGFATGMMDYHKLYTYWVTAVDEHGYESPRSMPFVAATLPRTNAPPWDPTDIPTNDPPAFAGTVSLANATARSAYSDSLATEASDPDSDPMYFFKVSGPDWLNVTTNGTLSGMPDVSDAGTNAFTFQVTAIGGSTQKVVNIVVDLPADNPAGAPAVPTGLGASVDDSIVNLSWNSNGEADLYGYNVYRSTIFGSLGGLLTTVVGTNATVDSTVANGTTYYYTLKAVDTIDNESGGAEISATPSDPDPAPAAPANLAATAGDYFVDLAWDANAEGDLAGYTIYRSGLSGTYSGDPIASNVTENTYRDSTALNGITYYYVVTASDSGGNESPVSNEDFALPSDIAPEPPVGLDAIARDGEVFLFWENSTDVDLASYSLYRSTTSGSYGSALATGITNNTWSDTSVVNGTTYYYTVTAVDAGAQESGPGNEAQATPQAGLLTTVFIGDAVSGAANNWINTSTNWDAGLPVGGSQGLILIDARYQASSTVQGYDVVQHAGFVSNDGINSLYMSGSVWLLDGSTAHIASRGTTVDNSQFTLNNGEANFSGNNKSTIVKGNASSITMNGGLMTIGQNLIVQNGAAFTLNAGTLTGADQIYLKSSASLALNGGATTADRFSSDATCTATFGGTTQGSLALLTGLGTAPTLNWLPGTQMSMTVASSNEWAEVLWDADLLTYNGQGKTALGKTWAQVTAADGLEPSVRFAYDSDTETLSLSFIDTLPPASPNGLNATAGNASASLTWNANSESDFASYSLFRSTTSGSYGSALTNGLTTTSFLDTGLMNDTTYYYVLNAADTNGNVSGYSAEVSAKPFVPDAIAPAAPIGLVVTAGDGSVSLAWDGNAESDLASYSLYRSTISSNYSLALVTGLSTTNYVDHSVTNGVTYYYSITAVDTSGNESIQSTEDSATPTDLPPAPPTGLAATAGEGSVSLVWNANGESDLASYSLYRSTTSGSYGAALTNGLIFTNFVDTAVVNGTTYYYALSATDTNSNESVKSAEESATPTDLPPAPPTGLAATPGDGSVSLIWNANAESDLASYSLYRSTTSGSYGGALATGLSTPHYIDSSVTNDITYYYVVTATDNASNESADSSEASATPAVPPSITFFTDADAADHLVSNPNNWSDGLPTNGVTGMIGINGSVPASGSPLAGYEVIQTNGTVNNANFTGTAHSGGQWTLSGGTYTTRSLALSGASTFVVSGGTAILGNNNKSVSVSDGSSFIVNDGTVTLGRNLNLDNGIFTLSGGTLTGDADTDIGTSATRRAGQMNFNGGVATLNLLSFGKEGTTATFGGSAIGSVTASGLTGNYVSLDWLPGTKMSLSVTNSTNTWAEVLWANGDLTYNSQDYTTLGAWSVVTNTDGLASGVRFNYDSGTATLSLVTDVPALEGYDQWAAGWGTNDIGSATNDFDADGMNNLYEYAMDGNPTNGLLPTNLPVFSRVGNGFLYVHPQRSGDPSLTYTVETTTNLLDSGAWTNQGYTVTGTNVTGGTLDFVTNDVDTVDDEKFIRLKIEQ